MKTDISALKNDMRYHKKSIIEIRKDQAAVKKSLEGLSTRVERLER
ncbi:MAG: hypothetical protein ACON31_06265 [Candidatus Puniceispirillaceae bacterium]